MQYYIDWVIWRGVFLLCGMFIFNINNTAFLITKIHSFDKSWQLVSIYRVYTVYIIFVFKAEF